VPTNLPPEYFEVERHSRAATLSADKIVLLEELIGTAPKHGAPIICPPTCAKRSEPKIEAHTKKGFS
jgi:hypothetical protein